MPNPKPQPADEPKIERWTAQRKAAITVDVLKGKISVPEASRKYGFTQGEYREWADEFMRGGIDAFKVNRKGLEAVYRAEVKRLQAKIGELVMDNEIRKEALRTIPLDENERRSIDSLLATRFQRPESAESQRCREAQRTTSRASARRSSMRFSRNASST